MGDGMKRLLAAALLAISPAVMAASAFDGVYQCNIIVQAPTSGGSYTHMGDDYTLSASGSSISYMGGSCMISISGSSQSVAGTCTTTDWDRVNQARSGTTTQTFNAFMAFLSKDGGQAGTAALCVASGGCNTYGYSTGTLNGSTYTATDHKGHHLSVEMSNSQFTLNDTYSINGTEYPAIYTCTKFW